MNIEDEVLMDCVFHNLWSASSPWIVSYSYGGFAEDPVVDVVHEDDEADGNGSGNGTASGGASGSGEDHSETNGGEG